MGLISASWQIFFRWNVNWNTIIYIDAGNGRYTRVERKYFFLQQGSTNKQGSDL